MATSRLIIPEDMDDLVTERKITLAEILSGQNLVEIMTDSELNKLGNKVVRDFEIDEESRTDWLKSYKRSLDIAMQVRKEKTFPWPKASNIKYPLLTTASIQFQARAYPAIVDGSNLVKGRVLGPDPDGTKRARADRIGQHMTWQLLYKMKDWEEQTDRLLLMLPITGCVFRKSYYDKIAGTNCSDMISADDFVINYWSKSLDAAPRYTHVLHLYPYEARERFAAGLWRTVTLEGDPENGDDDDALIDFYEQHRMADLDEDGIPEHYVVTTTTDGQVACVMPCFAPSDVFVKTPQGTKKLSELETDELDAPDYPIIRIERQQYFTKYGFIPAPDGSFYDIGFGTLLEDITAAIDGTINRMLDAGTLQNAGGGFIGSGIKLKAGNQKFTIGEWKHADTGSGVLKDNIFPMPAPGPSPVLFQLLGMLIEAAKQITSVQDVLTGAAQGPNTPATTVLAQIEQGQKVMTGIFKRVHRAFGQELRILRRLNRDFMDEEEYFQLNDEDKLEPQRGMGDNGGPPLAEDQEPQQDPGKIMRSDYEDEDLDVIPVSDPTIVSDVQKMAKAQALMEFGRGDPFTNQQEVRRRYYEAIGESDIKTLLTVPQAPNPELLIEAMNQHMAKMKLDIEALKGRASATDQFADAALKLGEAGLIQDAAAVAGVATDIATQGANDGEPAGGQGSVPGMEGQPPDTGLHGGAQPAPPGPDGSMGAGPAEPTGDSGVGGPAGGSGGPVA